MKNGKILIIDDNEDVLFALNLLLEPYVEPDKKVTTQPNRSSIYVDIRARCYFIGYEFPAGCDPSGQEGFFWLER